MNSVDTAAASGAVREQSKRTHKLQGHRMRGGRKTGAISQPDGSRQRLAFDARRGGESAPLAFLELEIRRQFDLLHGYVGSRLHDLREDRQPFADPIKESRLTIRDDRDAALVERCASLEIEAKSWKSAALQWRQDVDDTLSQRVFEPRTSGSRQSRDFIGAELIGECTVMPVTGNSRI
jgi:hypothetical protein